MKFVAWGRRDLFKAEIDRIQARLAGDIREVARLVTPQVYDQIRTAFAAEDPAEAILGRNDPRDGFQYGLAGLTPQEARAFELSLRMIEDGEPDLKEIAAHMDRTPPGWKGRPQRSRSQALFPEFRPATEPPPEPISQESANQYVYRARKKLEMLFGAGAPGGTSSSTPSLTPTQPSTATPDASAPATTTPKTSPRTPSFATSKTAISYASPSPC